MSRFKGLAGGLALSFFFSPPLIAGDHDRFTKITEDWQNAVYRQYDFWIGLYHANWRFKKPDRFFHEDVGMQATHRLYPTLNGKALLEFGMSDNPINEHGARVQGFSVRYYDPIKERWVMAQEWPDPNSTDGVSNQLQGFYRFGRIQVFSTLTVGNPLVERTRRYTFSDIRRESFQWHGVFTTDQGKTWTAGTLVEFTRIKSQAEWPAAGGPFPNYDNASQCTEDAYKAFDNLAGEWKGTVNRAGEESEATLTGFLMLGGCAVLNYLEFNKDGSPYTLLEVRSPGQKKTDWWVYRLDSLHGTPHTYQIGNFDMGKISLFDNNHFVIEDEFKNLSIRLMQRDDSRALKKTVWTAIGPDRLAFEWWIRETPDAEWHKEAAFHFERQAHFVD